MIVIFEFFTMEDVVEEVTFIKLALFITLFKLIFSFKEEVTSLNCNLPAFCLSFIVEQTIFSD